MANRSLSTNSLAVRVLASPPATHLARRLSANRLRIIAYHDVSDANVFRDHIRHIATHYEPVSGTDVVRAINGTARLPERATWVTFDDGHANVIEKGMPVLQEFGVPATLFVCPGLVEARCEPWWAVVDRALSQGWLEAHPDRAMSVSQLKSVPDMQRRESVESAAGFIGVTGTDTLAGTAQILNWMNAGLELGNHTWDHPCLDQCDEVDQRAQIRLAHEWLANIGAFERSMLFAYPNGDWTEIAEDELERLGYDLGLMFDHRLTDPKLSPRYQLSRVRLDSDADIRRAASVLSGAHSTAFHVLRGLR